MHNVLCILSAFIVLQCYSTGYVFTSCHQFCRYNMGTFFSPFVCMSQLFCMLYISRKKRLKVQCTLYFWFPFFVLSNICFANCVKKSSKIKAIFRSSPPKIIGGYNFKAWTWVSITQWQSRGNVQILVFSRNTNLKNQAPYKVKLYMRYDCGQSITSFQAKQFVKSELTWLKLKCGYQEKIDMSL